MPGPYVAPLEGRAPLPSEVDVVVIGAGIVGASTALELAERGLSVALCEKGGVAREQSGRNWGWVRLSRRDIRELPLMIEATRLWVGLEARVGADVGYRRTGIVFTFGDGKEEARFARYREHLSRFDIASTLLSGRQVREMYPDLDLPLSGALVTPDDGRAEPQLAGLAIARAAARAGAHVLTECAVRGLDLAGGRVAGVVTEHGLIRCERAVLAGGVWSNFFARRHGIDIPQLNVVASALRTAALPGGPEQAIWCKDFALRKRSDGGYTVASGHANVVEIVPRSFRYMRRYLPALKSDWRSLQFRLSGQFLRDLDDARLRPLDEAGAFEYTRVLDPRPSRPMVDGALRSLARRWPVFRQAQVAQRWAGCIDITPDAVPVIDRAAAAPGLFVAAGFSGHGFGIAPGAGKLMAQMVAGEAPCVDPAPFRLARFTDGTRMELMPDA